MNKRILNILPFVSVIPISIVFVLWQDGTIDPNKKRVSNGVYLLKNENKSFTALYGRNQNLIAFEVDSLIISKKFGTMIYGIGG